MFETVPFVGWRSNLIHYFNGEKMERDKVMKRTQTKKKRKRVKDEDTKQIIPGLISKGFSIIYNKLGHDCVVFYHLSAPIQIIPPFNIPLTQA
jgi:hypothetical protein